MKTNDTLTYYRIIGELIKNGYLSLLPVTKPDYDKNFYTNGKYKEWIFKVINICLKDNCKIDDKKTDLIKLDSVRIKRNFNFQLKITPDIQSTDSNDTDSKIYTYQLKENDITDETKTNTKYFLYNISFLFNDAENWKCEYKPTSKLIFKQESNNYFVNYNNIDDYTIGTKNNFQTNMYNISNIHDISYDYNKEIMESNKIMMNIFDNKLIEDKKEEYYNNTYTMQPLFGDWNFNFKYKGKNAKLNKKYKKKISTMKMILLYSRIPSFQTFFESDNIYKNRLKVIDVHDINRYYRN